VKGKIFCDNDSASYRAYTRQCRAVQDFVFVIVQSHYIEKLARGSWYFFIWKIN